MKIVLTNSKLVILLSLFVVFGIIFYPSKVNAAEVNGYQFFPTSMEFGDAEIPNACTRMVHVNSSMGYEMRSEITITRNEIGRITKLESRDTQSNYSIVFNIQYDASKLLPISGYGEGRNNGQLTNKWEETYTSNALGQIVSYAGVHTICYSGEVVEMPLTNYYYDQYGYVGFCDNFNVVQQFCYNEYGNIISTASDAFMGYCPYVYDDQHRLIKKIIVNDGITNIYVEYYYE